MRSHLKRLFSRAIRLGLAVTVLVGGLRFWVELKMRDRIYEHVSDVPPRTVAIVLGAGLWADGSLTLVLADRVSTAVELYQAGVVQKLLFTGDNRVVDYNEPQRMLEYAVALGVPARDIVLDYAGRRTYDSCYRAQAIFGITDAVVVTQRFHLARSLYLCDAMDIDSVGVVADRREYSAMRYSWEIREYLALALAWWDVNIRQPAPVLGEKLPIC